MTQGNPLTAIDRHGYIPAKIAERGFVALCESSRAHWRQYLDLVRVVVLHGRLARRAPLPKRDESDG